MVLARGGLFREGAEGKDRYARTQQASQNATRGHHTQTQDPEDSLGATPFGVCGSVRGAEGTAVRRGAASWK